MSKKLKASFVKTNIAKPVKLELFRIMRDYHTQQDREQAVARSKEIHDLSQVFKSVPISRDTFKRLKSEVNEMPFSEVLSLPKDLQDWILGFRPDLKQELEKQRLEQIEEPVNWIDDHSLKHNELPLIPVCVLPVVKDKTATRVSKDMELSIPSLQWWNGLLPSQKEQVLQTVDWLSKHKTDWWYKSREDYQAKINQSIAGRPSDIRVHWKR